MADPDALKKPGSAKKTDKPKRAAGGGSPGSLSLSPRRALGPFLGIVMPPLLVSLWCLIGWHDGWFRLRHPWTTDHTRSLALVLGGGGLAVCAFWIVLPVANWLRSWPAQRFASGNKIAWSVPLLAAAPVWIALYLAFVGCVALGGYALFHGLLQLGMRELINS